MPYRFRPASPIALAAAAALTLAACGSESPDSAQNAAPPPALAQSDASSSERAPAAPDSPSAASSSGPPPSSDGTLVAMVESAIKAEPELNTLDIEVSAEDGTIYLRGQASTRESRRLATEVANSVDGVQRVENELFVAAGTQSSQRRQPGLLALR